MSITLVSRPWRSNNEEVSLAATGTSDYVLIPDGVQNITISIVPGSSSTASVEVTNDTKARLRAGTAQWFTSSAGVVSSAALVAVNPAIKAVRLVVATGSARMVVTVA